MRFCGRFLILSAYFFVTRISLQTFAIKKIMAYYHVYTKGLEDREIFRDRDDFIMGMTLVAVVAFKIDVRVLAFVLMSNHVHFVLKCPHDKAETFIRMYKSLMSRYLHGRYGDVKFLHRLETAVDFVPESGDNLKRLIAYVLNNPVKAGIKCVAQGYEWSSARCYFNTLDSEGDTVSICSLKVREARRLLRTKDTLPGHWRINADKYIVPESYVDINEVESLYRTGRAFEYFLSVSFAARKSVNENITFSDEMIRSALNELLEKKYGAGSLDELDDFLRKNLLKDLRGRFSASPKQLARVSFISISDVIRYLEL